tara:strand:+ start:1040 stop:2047 length:1008 start_codon:yes stop_codon:yes gene_type:complete
MDQIISKQLRREQLMIIFEKNYDAVSPLWSHHQLEWINSVYRTYKDHDKYMIVLYLIKKTFDFYSKNFVKETYAEFFEKEFIEIDRFNVIEVSKALNIPKESTRRKINELQKSGVIKRLGKRIILDKSVFPYIKPENSIIRISRFLANLSNILYNEKVLTEEFDSTHIQDFIKKNFSHIWKTYYEVQIPMLLNWKKVFNDIEIFHIWGVCAVNQKLNSKRKINKKMNKKIYIEKFFFNHKDTEDGVNAMSISDISSIPRATVIRKLNILVKKKYLNINAKKHYTVASDHRILLSLIQKKNFNKLAEFVSQVFNLIIVDKVHFKKNMNLPSYLNPN